MTDLGQVLAHERSRDLLHNGELLHIAMETRRGPHVTPELFTWTAGRLWFATARRTLKARLLKTGAKTGLVISDGEHHLVLKGEARPLDPLRPHQALGSVTEAAASPLAATGFLFRNAPHLVGFAAQGPWALPHSPSTARMLIAIRPQAAALLLCDEVLLQAGSWQPRSLPAKRAPRSRAVLPQGLPGESQDLVESRSAAIVALGSSSGPVALPARWDPERATATVSTALLELAGVPSETDAAVEVERMDGYLMQGKRGILLRGRANLVDNGATSEVALAAERATFWEGMDTRTRKIS